MAILTIHTATYNRGYILGQAYESLRSQTNKDFEWIITDDGSTDNTEELVRSWMNEDNGFPIIYNKLNHVGKIRALNFGVEHSSTEWFMMLDSDDYFLPKTVELVIKWLEEIKEEKKIGGIGFAKCFPNKEYMKPQRPIIDESIGYVDASHIERSKFNLDMDMCEVHRTKLFRDFPFQVYSTEMFAPERLSYYEIAFAGWKLRWRNTKLCICNYLPDGLTKDNKIVKNNPMGYAMYYNQNLLIHTKFKERFTDAMQMIALCICAGHVGYLKNSNNMLVTILAFPIGVLLSIRRKIQFIMMN